MNLCATLHRILSKQGVTLKYRLYLRFYLIKIKRVLAKFGSEKKLKVKRAYFMATKINPFPTNTPFLNEGKIKSLQPCAHLYTF